MSHLYLPQSKQRFIFDDKEISKHLCGMEQSRLLVVYVSA